MSDYLTFRQSAVLQRAVEDGKRMKKISVIVIVAAAIGIAGAGYVALHSTEKDGVENSSAAKGDSNKSKQAVTVATTLAEQRDYAVKLSANGVVSAINTVDVRPQVSSTVTQVHIKEGQFVRAGETLFTLDSRSDQVNLAKAQAQLDKDMATLADNQRQLARSQDLFAKKFIAQSAVDTSLTLVQAQQAVIAADQAAIAAARVALSYNRIIAPSAGRTGIISVYPGSLVQPNMATPMVTVTQMNPVNISFPLPQRDLPDVLESMRRSKENKDSKDSFVMASLPDNELKFKGKLQFVDNAVDAASGTVKLKAVFDNKEMKLWPGAYAKVELSVRVLKDAIVVPQDAIIIGAKASSLYIVDADGRALMRDVVVLHTFGADAVVSGIAAGTKVILQGKENLRPGAMVKVVNGEGKAKPTGKGTLKSASATAASAS
jgi:RND family efflux transporter MFP subunit